jgi:glucodextranase-like protein
MQVGMVRTRRSLAIPGLTAAVMLIVGVSVAEAQITTSNITSPADGALLLQNADTNPNQTFTVSGTTDGTPGDLIDIDCYNGGSEVTGYAGPGGAGIAVGSGGAFTNVPVTQSNFAGHSCDLLAVPHGMTPAPTGFIGPRVGFSSFFTSKLTGAVNTGTTYDFSFDDATPTGVSDINSIDDCGPFTSLADGSAAMKVGPLLFFCAGSFYNSMSDFNGASTDMTRSEIEVDGQNAYGSSSAQSLFSGNPGFPALSVSLDSFDPTTGEAQTTESESLVKCAPNDVYDPSSSDCTSYAPTGVSIKRVTSFTNGGRVQTVADTYGSTNGTTHSLDLLYEVDLDGLTAGWKLPGETSFTQHSTGDTGPAPATAPSTVYGILDTSRAPSLTNPVGGLTFSTAYNSVRFDNSLWPSFNEDSALFNFRRVVPAGGSTTITWSYATGSSLPEVQSDAAASQDATQPPAVAISSPASGGVETTSPATITGTASAGSGIRSVVVNGVTATVTGSTWRATVPLTAGQDKLTAVLTSNAKNAASASETISYALTPTAAIASPASRGTYAIGQVVAAKFTCADGTGGPGLASCTDSNGASTGTGRLNTDSLGQHTYSVTAESRDGESSTASVTYDVVALKVSIASTRTRYSHGKTKLKLSCSGPNGAVCDGTLTLKIRKRERRHHKTIVKTVTLGHAGYTLAAGHSAFVTVRIGHAARTVHATATATVQHGHAASRRVTLTPAPKRHH